MDGAKGDFEWIFKPDVVLEVPTVKKDGWSVADEAWYRYRACQFLERVASRSDDVYLNSRKLGGLELDRGLLNKAKIFLHRFYLLNSFKACEYHEVCGALLFLVSKTGRSSRDARLLTDVVKRVALSAKKKPCGEKELQSWIQRLSYWEIEILSSLKFDLRAPLPHDTAEKFFERFPASKSVRKMAYRHLDDALRTTLVLRHSEKMVAYAAVYLTLQNANNTIADLPARWWRIMGISTRSLVEIAEEIKCARDEHETKRFARQRCAKLQEKDFSKN